MTETERLRALLNDRGVEWTNPNSCLRDEKTSWVANGFDYDALEDPYGSLILSAMHQDSLTPEQAIAATLGAGTCQLKPWKMERDTGFYDCMECDCGYVADVSDWAEWRHCPRCGKHVVKEDA